MGKHKKRKKDKHRNHGITIKPPSQVVIKQPVPVIIKPVPQLSKTGCPFRFDDGNCDKDMKTCPVILTGKFRSCLYYKGDV